MLAGSRLVDVSGDAGIRAIRRDLATVPLYPPPSPSKPYSDRPLLNEMLLTSCSVKVPFDSLFLFRPLESPPQRLHKKTPDYFVGKEEHPSC